MTSDVGGGKIKHLKSSSETSNVSFPLLYCSLQLFHLTILPQVTKPLVSKNEFWRTLLKYSRDKSGRNADNKTIHMASSFLLPKSP
jgi:hypothetical protein